MTPRLLSFSVNVLLSALFSLMLASARPLCAQETAAPGAGAAPSKSEADKWREDLRFMAEEMPKRHKNLFHTMTREQFDTAVKKLHERIPTLARHQIIVELARIVALVGDGHTNVAPTRDPKIGFRTYPLRLYLFKDGLYVRAAAREHADLVGSRVVRVGKATAGEAYDAAREIIGRDNEMDVKFFAPLLLAMPEVLHALGLIDDMESARLVVETRGAQKVVNLKPWGPAEMMPPDTDTSWLPAANWVDARDGAPTPLWLRDPRNKFWFEYLPDARAVYVQLNQVGNKEDETLEAFSKRLFAFVEANPVERLVLDLRLNRGGNGEFNRPLLLGLIKSAKVDQRGRLFAVVGRSTWSAAQFLVNELEKYTNAIFVGEPTGGKVNSYGDSRRITLPNSQVTVRVSTLWWQEDERDTRPWTAPQLAADLTFDDYRAGIDPALKAILGYVPQKSLSEVLKEALSAGDDKLAAERYREWRSDPVNVYRSGEAEVNGLGYELLALKRVEQAVRVFELNAAAYPRSANVYDSLAEAYAAAGNRELAIRNYEKALELDPSMASAVEALKRLRGSAPAQGAPKAGRASGSAGCMCNEDSFAQTPCALSGAPPPGERERRAREEIQARIDETIAADKAEDIEAAMRFNTPDFSAKQIDGKVIALPEVKKLIQANYDYIIAVSDKTRVRIDCLVLEGDEAQVYINQHFVRTVPTGLDRVPRELVTNVTHREVWVRTPQGWLRRHIEELHGGPYFMDGKRLAPRKPYDPEAPPYDPDDPHARKSLADAMLATVSEKGIASAVEQYRALRGSSEYYVTEQELNSLGYRLLGMKKVGEAVEVFKLNVEAYPQSSNVYDSLAEAYMTAGDRESAVKNYRRSLELNSKNANAVEMLKKLGAN